MNYLDLADQMMPAWHARAACHPENGHDPALWFPRGEQAKTAASRQKATAPGIAICRTCPVRTRCLDDAIKRGETHGIHGGVDFETPRTHKEN